MSKFQFEEAIPESTWGANEVKDQQKRNHGALVMEPFSGKDVQYGRTAYQESAPTSNLEVGSRDRVFAILSPLARRVAVQEVDFCKKVLNIILSFFQGG